MYTLGCGPFFSQVGFGVSLVSLLVVKPLTYFAFIQAFRFRVSRGIPMSFGRAAGLTAIRAGLGAALLLAVYGAIRLGMRGEPHLGLAWMALLAERVGIWFLLGRFGAQLRGRRLVGWTISGTAIDVAFDAAMGLSLLGEWVVVSGIAVAMIAFIVPLTLIGRRDSLKARFTRSGVCRQCEYDLTGNLSGQCPECGTPVAAPRPT